MNRAAAVWFDYRAFNQLPRHVPAVDMVLRSTAGAMRSVGDAEELLRDHEILGVVLNQSREKSAVGYYDQY